MNNNSNGYSLVELMVVVAIIGVLASYATFNYSAGASNLKQATRELYGNMQLAKMEAIKRNENVIINFNPLSDNYVIYVDNPAGTAWSYDAIDDTIGGGTISMPSDSIDMTGTTLPWNSWVFAPSGMAHPNIIGAAGTLALDVKLEYTNADPNKKRYMGIRFTLVGNVRVTESTDGGTTWN